mmetsp:Transcript_23896/g.56941  ORF Transcript_23896/g.56941 Transcript_23896/m.56941 type:complete len:220 (-) Transcript_23896:264-923(-)
MPGDRRNDGVEAQVHGAPLPQRVAQPGHQQHGARNGCAGGAPETLLQGVPRLGQRPALQVCLQQQHEAHALGGSARDHQHHPGPVLHQRRRPPLPVVRLQGRHRKAEGMGRGHQRQHRQTPDEEPRVQIRPPAGHRLQGQAGDRVCRGVRERRCLRHGVPRLQGHARCVGRGLRRLPAILRDGLPALRPGPQGRGFRPEHLWFREHEGLPCEQRVCPPL